ncbi:restriction endonuclease PLD domain-containing protein [Exiguobacterium sp. R-39]|uniref:restriction endonuclease PLD domain-containing protein n=1 Tax=Exiguobacterium sp. R-39 TaxID=3416708 RepID=UPI003CE95A4B
MYLINNLENHVLENPYAEGHRHLRVLSGYVSPVFVQHVMESYDELFLEVTVGMTSMDGVANWHHQAFLGLVNQFADRLIIRYQTSQPGNHRKVYYWHDDILEEKVFVGSANFTRNGFGRQKEVLVEVTFSNVEEIFTDLNVIQCNSPHVEEAITFYSASPRRITTQVPVLIDEPRGIENVQTTIEVLSTPTNTYSDYVDLSLLNRNTGEVPERSGLNWGQREGRDHNQAYLSVPLSIHNGNPDFFPPSVVPFVVITDDGESLICVMAQQNRKGIQTRESNSIMGAYFRRRLGMESGAFVTVADLRRYGRDSVRIYKIDEETFYLDFGV